MAKTGNPPPRQEAPSYQRQSNIQPVADTAHLRYAEAMSGSPSSTAFSDVLGSIGQQIAQNASSEQARLKGVEAAKTPGRTLFPAFNDTTKAFNDAYRSEESQILQFEAEKFLNNVYHESSLDLNPSAKTLFTFEETAKKGIDDVLSQSENITPDIKRHLEKSYESKYLHLSERVFDSNRRFLKEQNAAQQQLNETEMMNSMRDGNPEASQSYYNQALQNIYSAAAQNNTPPEKVALQERALKRDYVTGNLQRQYIDTPNKDKPAFLANAREKISEDVGAEDADAIVAGLEKFSNQYESSYKSQQYINYIKYKSKLDNGEMTKADLAEMEDEVDASQLSKLQLDAAKGGSKSFKLENNARQIVENYDNGVFLFNQTPAPINHAVDKIIIPIAEQQKGEALTLAEQGELLSSFKAPVESYQNRLSGALEVGSDEQKLDAARAINSLKSSNPVVLKGMSKNDLALASMYKKYSQDPKYQGPGGLDLIKDKMLAITPEAREERQRQVRTYSRDNHFNDADYLKIQTYQALDIKYKKGKTPPLKTGATTEYANLVIDGIYTTGDEEIAKKDAAAQMKANYGVYGGKVMRTPPTKVYTDMGYVLENSKMKAVKEMVDTNNDIKKNGGFALNDLEWADAPDFSDMTSRPLGSGNPKIKIDGVLRDVVIDSDLDTQLSSLENMSWSLGYLDEFGQMMPLINPFARTGNYRFKPSKELYQETQSNPEVVKKISDYEQEQLQKAMNVRESVKREKERAIDEFNPRGW